MRRGRLFLLVGCIGLLFAGIVLWQRYTAESNGGASLARPASNI
jgi:hypothetical protein